MRPPYVFNEHYSQCTFIDHDHLGFEDMNRNIKMCYSESPWMNLLLIKKRIQMASEYKIGPTAIIHEFRMQKTKPKNDNQRSKHWFRYFAVSPNFVCLVTIPLLLRWHSDYTFESQQTWYYLDKKGKILQFPFRSHSECICFLTQNSNVQMLRFSSIKLIIKWRLFICAAERIWSSFRFRFRFHFSLEWNSFLSMETLIFKEIIYLNASNASKTISRMERSARWIRAALPLLKNIRKISNKLLFTFWFVEAFSATWLCFVRSNALNWMHCWMQSFKQRLHDAEHAQATAVRIEKIL